MGQSVLVCDDAAFMRLMLKNILEQHGLKYGVDSVYGEYSKFWFEIM